MSSPSTTILYVYHRHPALLSFPTRRSSDLSHHRLYGAGAYPLCLGYKYRSKRHHLQNTGSNHCCRSEEHTSELQSRGHLVCRLLLEKKNKSWGTLPRPCGVSARLAPTYHTT